MGSEFYAYFTLESEKVSSRELEELAHDAGAADLPTPGGKPGRRPARGGQQGAPGPGGRAVVQQRAPAPVRPRERQEPARQRGCGQRRRRLRRRPRIPAQGREASASQTANLRGRCPARRARPECRASTRSTTSCARAAARRWPGSGRACAASPTTSGMILPYDGGRAGARLRQRAPRSASRSCRSTRSSARSIAAGSSTAASARPRRACARAGSTSPPRCGAARRCRRSICCGSGRSTSSATGTIASRWRARWAGPTSTPTSPRS